MVIETKQNKNKNPIFATTTSKELHAVSFGCKVVLASSIQSKFYPHVCHTNKAIVLDLSKVIERRYSGEGGSSLGPTQNRGAASLLKCLVYKCT